MHPILNIAVRAARKAGNLIVKYYGILNNSKINQENGNDFITNLNKAAEIIIAETIHKSYPKHIIVTEELFTYKEECEYKSIDQNIQWIIVPLDGITNYLKCLPFFAVSIAVCVRGHAEVAVIYDPIRNELFTAIRDQNAQVNGFRLQRSNICSLSGSILATGFPLKTKKKYSDIYINSLKKLFHEHANFRIIGSVALSLAYVAAGRVDGYFEIGLKPRNFIAGDLIARKSGALVCDFSGSHNYTSTGSIIAGNSKMVKAILMKIRSELDEVLKE